ncbi:MAG: hypothetical protein ACKOEC_07555 [Acidimicrobiia bacterium]
MSPISSPRGFTLFETLIATGILITALAGVAQLFVLASQLAKKGSASGMALLAGQNKLEELSGLAFNYDSSGQPETDVQLTPSPSDTLEWDAPQYVDWLDPAGDPQPDAPGAAFARRWRIASLDDETPEALVLEVCVFVGGSAGRPVASADICLSTLRARQP